LLGKPNAKYGRYDIDNQEIEFFYSKGRCLNGWDVPEDTIIDIAVNPKQSPRLSDLKVELSKYERFRDPHVTSHVYYTNRDEGIRYVVYEDEEDNGKFNGRVLTVYYESTSEDERILCCRKSAGRTDLVPSMTYGAVNANDRNSYFDSNPIILTVEVGNIILNSCLSRSSFTTECEKTLLVNRRTLRRSLSDT